jgi:hypothetical protein
MPRCTPSPRIHGSRCFINHHAWQNLERPEAVDGDDMHLFVRSREEPQLRRADLDEATTKILPEPTGFRQPMMIIQPRVPCL